MSVECFTAVLDKSDDSFGPFPEQKTVVFNKIVTNVGNGYNQYTGIFTAPVAGCYCFSFSYSANQEEPSGLILMKNNEVILKAVSKMQLGSYFVDNASSTACLQLNNGDAVYVVLPPHHHVRGTDSRTSFSGFLMN